MKLTSLRLEREKERKMEKETTNIRHNWRAFCR
jgi:hypothetical protein